MRKSPRVQFHDEVIDRGKESTFRLRVGVSSAKGADNWNDFEGAPIKRYWLLARTDLAGWRGDRRCGKCPWKIIPFQGIESADCVHAQSGLTSWLRAVGALTIIFIKSRVCPARRSVLARRKPTSKGSHPRPNSQGRCTGAALDAHERPLKPLPFSISFYLVSLVFLFFSLFSPPLSSFLFFLSASISLCLIHLFFFFFYFSLSLFSLSLSLRYDLSVFHLFVPFVAVVLFFFLCSFSLSLCCTFLTSSSGNLSSFINPMQTKVQTFKHKPLSSRKKFNVSSRILNFALIYTCKMTREKRLNFTFGLRLF